MQKIDGVTWIASFCNFGFMYVNLTHLLEAAQVLNVVASSIGTILSSYLVAVTISEHKKKRSKNG